MMQASSRNVISTPKAPSAIGPYSQGITTGKLLFTSGQIGLLPSTGELIGANTAEQAKQAFANLAAVIDAAGASLNDVVKLTLYLTDLSEFAEVNGIMQTLMPSPYPARTTVGVASLPKGARFEVDAIVALP